MTTAPALKRILLVDPAAPAGKAYTLAHELHAQKRISEVERAVFEAALWPALEAEYAAGAAEDSRGESKPDGAP